jgi:predicted transcriptional regulator
VRRKLLTISSLAVEVGCNRGAVTRDVKKLAEFGLVRVWRQNNPGDGIVQIDRNLPVKHIGDSCR